MIENIRTTTVIAYVCMHIYIYTHYMVYYICIHTYKLHDICMYVYMHIFQLSLRNHVVSY